MKISLSWELIKAYFDLAPISQLIHRTRTRNVGINRMLDKFIPFSETRYIDKPDGIAGPGEFHLRFVKREDIPKILPARRNSAQFRARTDPLPTDHIACLLDASVK